MGRRSVPSAAETPGSHDLAYFACWRMATIQSKLPPHPRNALDNRLVVPPKTTNISGLPSDILTPTPDQFHHETLCSGHLAQRHLLSGSVARESI